MENEAHMITDKSKLDYMSALVNDDTDSSQNPSDEEPVFIKRTQQKEIIQQQRATVSAISLVTEDELASRHEHRKIR